MSDFRASDKEESPPKEQQNYGNEGSDNDGAKYDVDDNNKDNENDNGSHDKQMPQQEDEKEKDNEANWKDEDFLSFDNHSSSYSSSATTNPKKKKKKISKHRLPDQALQENNGEEVGIEGREREGGALPPWMTANMDTTACIMLSSNPLVRLHNEIVQFTQLVQPTRDEIQQRHDLVERLRDLVNDALADENPKMSIFGSLATGIFLPSSDIDIVIHTSSSHQDNSGDGGDNDEDKDKSKKDDNNNDNNNQGFLLNKLADALRNEWLAELSYLEVIENTRVPLVKIIHEPTGIAVDISFNQDMGVEAVHLVKEYLHTMPPMRPLVFVLKYYLQTRSMNEPYTGGVGSFLLQLMVVSFLQQREREAATFRRPLSYNLGALLLEFLEFFGTEFNYITTGIAPARNTISGHNRNGYAPIFFAKAHPKRREYFLKDDDRDFSLAMENPLDPTMDVGVSSFRIQILQRAFEISHKLLSAHMTVRELAQPSMLAVLFPAHDPDLQERARRQEQRTSMMATANNEHDEMGQEQDSLDGDGEGQGLEQDEDEENEDTTKKKKRKKGRNGGQNNNNNKKASKRRRRSQ